MGLKHKLLREEVLGNLHNLWSRNAVVHLRLTVFPNNDLHTLLTVIVRKLKYITNFNGMSKSVGE